jgi:prophage maintenance system killer protein
MLMSEIVIYTAKDGHVELDVSLADETIWLSQQQIADLFGTERPAITKHLRNIFNYSELDENSVCSILERTASDGKRYKTKFYNLDAIVSVGYRVNSNQATQFRIWATQVLREHLVRGYTIYDKRLSERGVQELQKTVELLQKTLVHHDLVNDLGKEAIQLILAYSKTWDLLLAYDEEQLELPSKGKETSPRLNYQIALKAIESLKVDLSARNEATYLFGQECAGGLDSILNNIEQTFDGEPLYKTAGEKAAHLLYFVIKDHPFTDGNKRIGSFMFLLYLKSQNMPIKLNENGLVALALLVAESDPKQKEMMIRLVVNLIN